MEEALQYELADNKSMLYRDVIDKEGDILLRLGIREFLVSSKVLALASSYFDIIFRSEFSEGCAIRNLAVPLSIKLSNSNLEALAVLLYTIYFSRKRRYLELQLNT